MKIVIKNGKTTLKTDNVGVALNVLLAEDNPEVTKIKDKIAFEQLAKLQEKVKEEKKIEEETEKATKGIIKKAQDGFQVPEFAPVKKKNKKRTDKRVCIPWSEEDINKFVRAVIVDKKKAKEIYAMFPNRSYKSIQSKSASIRRGDRKSLGELFYAESVKVAKEQGFEFGRKNIAGGSAKWTEGEIKLAVRKVLIEKVTLDELKKVFPKRSPASIQQKHSSISRRNGNHLSAEFRTEIDRVVKELDNKGEERQEVEVAENNEKTEEKKSIW